MGESEEEETRAAERQRVRPVGEEDAGRARGEADEVHRHAGGLPPPREPVGDAARDHDADDAAGVVPDDGVERGHGGGDRALERRIGVVRRLHVDGRPDGKAEVREHLEAEGEHQQPGAGLRGEREEGLLDGGLRGGAGGGGKRLRVAQKEREHDEPEESEAAEDPERIAPAARAEAGEPAGAEGDEDDGDVERALHDGKRGRARLLVELAEDRRRRGRQQALSDREHDAEDDREEHDDVRGAADACEARQQAHRGEERDGERDDALAAEEIAEHAAEEDREAVDEREDAHDGAPVGGGDGRVVLLHLRQHGVEDLPRALLHEIADREQREGHPLVVVLLRFVVHLAFSFEVEAFADSETRESSTRR